VPRIGTCGAGQEAATTARVSPCAAADHEENPARLTYWFRAFSWTFSSGPHFLHCLTAEDLMCSNWLLQTALWQIC